MYVPDSEPYCTWSSIGKCYSFPPPLDVSSTQHSQLCAALSTNKQAQKYRIYQLIKCNVDILEYFITTMFFSTLESQNQISGNYLFRKQLQFVRMKNSLGTAADQGKKE